MSYSYRILNDRPRHFYPLVAGALAWNDATGRANGEKLGNPTEAPPLVIGGGNSYVMTGSDNMRFASTLFHSDSVSRPFTLEAWFKPVTVTGVKGIVGHLGTTDGLTYDGERISFATVHGAAGEARASWFPPAEFTSYHVIGVHTEDRNELYANGILVASVDVTQEQLAFGYEVPSAPGFLYVGHASGTIVVDAVAAYDKALTSRQAKLHFLWGRDVPDLQEVVGKRGGDYWDFTDARSDVAFDFRFDTDTEWLDAQAASVRVADDILTPDFAADGTTVEGTWIAGFVLPAIIDTVDGSKVEFDGDGNYSIHTSINNGTTWSPAVNGREVTGLGTGVSTAGKSLQVRVTFPAGEPEDTITKLRSLSIKIYRDRDSSGTIAGNPAVFTGKAGLASEQRQPIEQSERMGVEFYDGGYATLASLTGYRTLEFWVRANATQSGTSEWWHIFDFRNTDGTGNGYLARGTLSSNWSATGGTTYVNGVQTLLNSNFAFTPGRWYHVVFVLDAASTNRLLINNNYVGDVARSMSIGMMAAYSKVMTGPEAIELYNAYLGIPNQLIVEPTGLDIDDAPTDTVKIYSYDWSIIGSG